MPSSNMEILTATSDIEINDQKLLAQNFWDNYKIANNIDPLIDIDAQVIKMLTTSDADMEGNI